MRLSIDSFGVNESMETYEMEFRARLGNVDLFG
jgi:hypothetical protein